MLSFLLKTDYVVAESKGTTTTVDQLWWRRNVLI